MSKFSGHIGYLKDTGTDDTGVYHVDIERFPIHGDLIRLSRDLSEQQQKTDEITLGNRFSIVASSYATQNFTRIAYIEYLGTKWKATSVEVQSPRLIITVGGVYNE